MWFRYVTTLGFSVLESRISQTCPPSNRSICSPQPFPHEDLACKTPGREKQSLVPRGKGKELSNTCHSSPLLHRERRRSFSLGSNRGERRQKCYTILAFPHAEGNTISGKHSSLSYSGVVGFRVL